MPSDVGAPTNWFDQGGHDYARFRPQYPPELSKFLGRIAPSKDTAVDVGCGSGQLSAQLADWFDSVIGVDPSVDQIANARFRGKVRYVRASAEKLPLADRSASLVTAAQAAHWFDLPAFYAEARRIAVDDAIVALISYGVLELGREVQERFSRFYDHEIGPYWPPQRRLVDSGYAGIGFPFDERPAPAMAIRTDWNLGELLGYVGTWSAVRNVRRAGREDILETFAGELAERWGDPLKKRPVVWPVNLRVGTVGAARWHPAA